MRPRRIVFIGDFLDLYSVSSHQKSPSVRVTLADEIKAGCEALDDIETWGAEEVHYCSGNHEHRAQRFLEANAPELYGVMRTVPELLRIQERGWHWHPYRTVLELGKVAYTHDLGRAGGNAVRTNLSDYGNNIVTGHTHRLAVHYGGLADGTTHVSMSVGHLSDVDSIDYMHRFKLNREWQHGFGWVDYDGDVGHCHAVPIIDGHCMLDGVRF
jgi:hypothetical protein